MTSDDEKALSIAALGLLVIAGVVIAFVNAVSWPTLPASPSRAEKTMHDLCVEGAIHDLVRLPNIRRQASDAGVTFQEFVAYTALLHCRKVQP